MAKSDHEFEKFELNNLGFSSTHPEQLLRNMQKRGGEHRNFQNIQNYYVEHLTNRNFLADASS